MKEKIVLAIIILITLFLTGCEYPNQMYNTNSPNDTFVVSDAPKALIEENITSSKEENIIIRANNTSILTRDIPDIMIDEDTVYTGFDLDNFVLNNDNANTKLVWSFSGNVNIDIIIDPITHIVTFVPAPDWDGMEIVTFTAIGPDGVSYSDKSIITVRPLSDDKEEVKK